MNNFPVIRKENNKDVLNAKDFYEFMEYDKSQWKRWYVKNIISNPFCIEGEDWVGFDTMSNGNTSKDFVITLDFAKRLAMMARTEKGEEARQYFISCEEKLKSTEQKPMSALDIMQMSITVLKEHESRLNQVENKIDNILKIQQESMAELTMISMSNEVLPEESTRTKIVKLVNAIHRSTNIAHANLWDRIYSDLYYLYHISIKARNKMKSESWLDVAERLNYLDQIYAIASNMARNSNVNIAA